MLASLISRDKTLNLGYFNTRLYDIFENKLMNTVDPKSGCCS